MRTCLKQSSLMFSQEPCPNRIMFRYEVFWFYPIVITNPKRKGLGPQDKTSSALLACRLLLAGCLFAERLDKEVLTPLWQRIVENACASARACAPRIWIRKRDAWRSHFNQKLTYLESDLKTGLACHSTRGPSPPSPAPT